MFGKRDFKYLIQGLDCKKLDLVNQKIFYPFEHMSGFENFKKRIPNKKKVLKFVEK